MKKKALEIVGYWAFGALVAGLAALIGMYVVGAEDYHTYLNYDAANPFTEEDGLTLFERIMGGFVALLVACFGCLLFAAPFLPHAEKKTEEKVG